MVEREKSVFNIGSIFTMVECRPDESFVGTPLFAAAHAIIERGCGGVPVGGVAAVEAGVSVIASAAVSMTVRCVVVIVLVGFVGAVVAAVAIVVVGVGSCCC